ncbi:MAG: hypothetical protein HY892_21500 [Deltaproteobacteria bacterium]|nr:hypothetical protein [Deltaproteobacteria bacterium]
MKKRFYLQVSIMVSCLLASTGVPGFSFVTPEHYEKLKQEARTKEKNENKPDREVPGKIQVHHPAEATPSPLGPTKK